MLDEQTNHTLLILQVHDDPVTEPTDTPGEGCHRITDLADGNAAACRSSSDAVVVRAWPPETDRLIWVTRAPDDGLDPDGPDSAVRTAAGPVEDVQSNIASHDSHQ